ncbi:MAG: hypothetical protein F6K57_28615, partial [Moorea sp. SIO4A5]|nr:hypothetical protein [Moorena sp. SIO4A5]
MNTPPLDEALKTYEIALDNLEDSASPMSEEQIIAVLNARDFVHATVQAKVYHYYHEQKTLVALDVRLKQNAWQISK